MRKYDMGHKIDAIEVITEIGATKASKELGIPQGTLEAWIYKNKKGEFDTRKVNQGRRKMNWKIV